MSDKPADDTVAAPAKKDETPVAHKPDLDFTAKLQQLSAEKSKRDKLDKEPYVKELKARIAELEEQLALVGGSGTKGKK